MYQDIEVGPPSTLYWDMRYRSHCPTTPLWCPQGFDLAKHYLAVRIRDLSGVFLEDLFITKPGAPLALLKMDPYWANLAAYAGKTVRLSVEIQAAHFLDVQLDNFKLVANPPVVVPPVVVPPVVVPPMVVPPVVVPPAPLVGEDGEGQHGEMGNVENSGATPK
jgi:hypothetical protein